MPPIVGLWISLLLAAPAQQINLNLPPPPPAAPPPRPLWSNFQVAVPKPASRLAWLPSYFHTPPKPPPYRPSDGPRKGIGGYSYSGSKCRGGRR